MYIEVNHPTLDILDKTHDLLKAFAYGICGLEMTTDFLDKKDVNGKFMIYDWFQPRITMSRYHSTSMPTHTNMTYWHNPSTSTKALRLYIRDDDTDIGIKDSCRFEIIHSHDSLKPFGVSNIPDLLTLDHNGLAKLVDHISLKEINRVLFEKRYDKADIMSTYKSVKRDIQCKLRHSQINETALFVKDKYGIRLPLTDHKHSDLFKALLGQGCFRDFLPRC